MPISTLNVTWTGENSATATAKITLDTDLVKVLPAGNAHIAVEDIRELTVTVDGAAAGNGTFTKEDFTTLTFYSRFPLDFSKELIGQEADASLGLLAFGTPNAAGGAGAFTLQGTGAAPRRHSDFTILTNGAQDPADVLSVTSITP